MKKGVRERGGGRVRRRGDLVDGPADRGVSGRKKMRRLIILNYITSRRWRWTALTGWSEVEQGVGGNVVGLLK